MNVALTDEQRLLAEVAHELAAQFSPADLRSLPGALDGGDRSLLDVSGWLEMRLPETIGGTAASCVDVALIAEECGRALATSPFIGPMLAVELLVAAGATAEEHMQYAAADALTVAALSGSLTQLARAPGGAVAFDCAGATAAVYVDGERRLRPASIARRRPRVVDITRQCADVEDAVDAEPVGSALPDEAVERVTAFGLALVSADALGVASAALQSAVEHAKVRHQFGRAIGSFQAVAHLLADAHVSIEAIRSVVWHAAWAVDALPASDALHAARCAKAFTSAAAVDVVERAVQVFGGSGLTWESPVSACLRRVLLDRLTFGDEAVHYRALADAGPHAHGH